MGALDRPEALAVDSLGLIPGVGEAVQAFDRGRASAEALDLTPSQCMMVAAHSNDLKAAATCGLRTAHVARPNEHGPGTGETAPKAPVDIAAASLEDLAAKLGA